MEDAENGSADFQVQGDEPGSARAARLRQAMRGRLTARELSRVSGVPFGTLQNYLAGGELKLSNAAAIARAADVRLEWLATGEGPMRAGEAESYGPSATPPAVAPTLPRIQDVVALEDMVVAYEGALRAFHRRGVTSPEPRKILALTFALYDAAMETLAEEDAASDATSTQNVTRDQS